MLEVLRQKWPLSLKASGIVVVVSIFLFVGVLIAPAFIFPTTEAGTEDLQVSTESLFVSEDKEEISFDSDTRVEVLYKTRAKDISAGWRYEQVVMYDADTDRILIETNPGIEENNFYSELGVDEWRIDYYFERDTTSGKFKKYEMTRVYDGDSESWTSMEDSSVFGDYDDPENACFVDETRVVSQFDANQYERSYRIAYRGPSSMLVLMSPFVDIGSKELANGEREYTINEGYYSAAQGWYPGFVYHITDSEGRAIARPVETSDGDTSYEVYESNVTAEGYMYRSIRDYGVDGLPDIPVTIIWDRSKTEMSQSISVDQSQDVTVEKPEWVRQYEEQCG